MTADGFVAGENGEPVKITSKAQDKKVHQMRADHQAILVGDNTVLNDDPHLGVRHVEGDDPLRIVVSSDRKLPKTLKIFRDKNVMIARPSAGQKMVDLEKLFKDLAQQGISSILVEPGPTLYASLKKLKLIDELIVFRGKKKIGPGAQDSNMNDFRGFFNKISPQRICVGPLERNKQNVSCFDFFTEAEISPSVIIGTE